MADPYYRRSPPQPGGNQYTSHSQPSYAGQKQHTAPQGLLYPPPPSQRQPQRNLHHEQERDYGSPIPQNSQVTPYQPYSRQQLSSPQAGLAPYTPHIPYFDPPPHERSSSRDSHSRHHGHSRRHSESRSHHSRPPAVHREKSGGSFKTLGADLVGVAGGSYLGHKFAGGGLSTVLGALAGGFVAHKANKKREGNREKKRRGSYGDGETVESSESSRPRGRRGSAPAPLRRQLYPPDAGRSRTHSRSGRTRSSSRRHDSTSDDNSSEDDHRRRRRH